MARHLMLDPVEADDLVQQTYLNALRAGETFELTEHGVRPWLFKILHNLHRSRLHQLARQPALIDDPENQRDGRGNHAGDCNVNLSELDWDRVDERLKHAIHALPQQMRSVFLLIAVEGLKYRQVADILGIPPGTVMSTLHRARQRLLSMLADLAAERHVAGLPHRARPR
jgi:RNA polymerase sigma-70 factor (ECF subfamily)